MEAQFAKLVEDNESANLALRKRRNHARSELSRSISQYDKELLEISGKIEVRPLVRPSRYAALCIFDPLIP